MIVGPMTNSGYLIAKMQSVQCRYKCNLFNNLGEKLQKTQTGVWCAGDPEKDADFAGAPWWCST